LGESSTSFCLRVSRRAVRSSRQSPNSYAVMASLRSLRRKAAARASSSRMLKGLVT